MLHQEPSESAMDVSHPDRDEEPTSSQEQTQEATQRTDEDGSTTIPRPDGWAYLAPINGALNKITFANATPVISIGRNAEKNLVVLPGMKISNSHCEIRWDGRTVEEAVVVLLDKSTNGTFVNGEKVGRGATRLLKSGNELAFGTLLPQSEPLYDYRFIYHFSAAGPPTEGLHSQYDMAHTLGSGAFATVMKAMARQSGKWYAVKIIHDKTAAANSTNSSLSSRNEKSKEDKRKTLAREISIMHKLRHPNICELREVFIEKNRDICLVLEFVDGGDLLDYIMKRDRLEEEISRHFAYQICDALQYTHKLGVAHRDLKPENILLTTDEPPRIKIGDFGLAKSIDHLTVLKTMCGTPAYIAPEVVSQAAYKPGYTLAVDAWSVGVITYSMVTGSSSFINDDSPDIRVRVQERKVDWATLQESGVTDECIQFVAAFFEMDPARRMTMEQALRHQWLVDYKPIYDNQDWYEVREGQIRPSKPLVHDLTASIFPDEDSVMATGDDTQFSTHVSEAMREMEIASTHSRDPSMPPPVAIPPRSQQPASQGPKSKLVRRSQIMAQIYEGSVEAPDPPPELVAYWNQYEGDLSMRDVAPESISTRPPPPQWTAEDPDSNKRPRELSDVVEEKEEPMDADEPNGSLDGSSPTKKKGRGGAKRGRAKATNEPGVALRRSARKK